MSTTQTQDQKEIAVMLVEVLKLELPANEIDPELSLFGDGLGLDSIDVLELAFAISKRYGITIKSGSAENTEIFANLASLSAYIQTHRTH